MITINSLEPTFATFPNGEVNVTFQPSLEASLVDHVTIDWRFQNNDEIVKLGLILNLIDTYETVETVHVHIPFLPYSRMDRHEPGYHNPMSLMVLTSILDAYADQVSVNVAYDTDNLHNPKAFEVIEDLHGKTVDITVNRTIVAQLDKVIRGEKRLNPDDVLVVFPDKGALARYSDGDDNVVAYLNNYTNDQPHIAVGQKARNFETHEITGYELDSEIPEGISEIIIIDDVISYGGTFIKLYNAIREKTDVPVSIVASHAENALWRGDLLALDVTIYTTKSLNDHHFNPDQNVIFFEDLD